MIRRQEAGKSGYFPFIIGHFPFVISWPLKMENEKRQMINGKYPAPAYCRLNLPALALRYRNSHRPNGVVSC